MIGRKADDQPDTTPVDRGEPVSLEGALEAESSRAPLRAAFPAKLAPRWMPRLFPDAPAWRRQ